MPLLLSTHEERLPSAFAVAFPIRVAATMEPGPAASIVCLASHTGDSAPPSSISPFIATVLVICVDTRFG